MRLIDADKLKATAILGLHLQHADSRYYYFYEEETIDNAPTVEAIPIEWLYKHHWHGVIDEWIWEKENDKETEEVHQ